MNDLAIAVDVAVEEVRFDHGSVIVTTNLIGADGDEWVRLQFRGGDGLVQSPGIEIPLAGLEAVLEAARGGRPADV